MLSVLEDGGDGFRYVILWGGSTGRSSGRRAWFLQEPHRREGTAESSPRSLQDGNLRHVNFGESCLMPAELRDSVYVACIRCERVPLVDCVLQRLHSRVRRKGGGGGSAAWIPGGVGLYPRSSSLPFPCCLFETFWGFRRGRNFAEEFFLLSPLSLSCSLHDIHQGARSAPSSG
ncbi:hypothetical protein LY78DRAFT_458205 [Colletotrichum sublineola]|nr:hypothetical protein LY78DRAFT_458205 [Colletotrichum sublineola]